MSSSSNFTEWMSSDLSLAFGISMLSLRNRGKVANVRTTVAKSLKEFPERLSDSTFFNKLKSIGNSVSLLSARPKSSNPPNLPKMGRYGVRSVKFLY